MAGTVDLTDSYELRDVDTDDVENGWESGVAWAADRHEDGEDPAVETVEFEAHRGLVEAIDHRTTKESTSLLVLLEEELEDPEEELGDELEDVTTEELDDELEEKLEEKLAEQNATVDDEWDIDPVLLEYLVAGDLGLIEENDVDRDFELGNVYSSDEVPDIDADDVETVTVRLPLREGVATQLEETMAKQDRDAGEFLRGVVVHQAAHFNGPHGPGVSEETFKALSDDQQDRIFEAREDAMAEWLGRVARGDDIQNATKDGWERIAEVQAEVTSQLDATEAESESEEQSGQKR